MNLKSVVAPPRRPAFTLIELLVVMAIIAILVGLLLAGVMYMYNKADDTTNRNDILQLSAALERFKERYKFYPPNQLKLCAFYADYDDTKLLDRQSKQCLSRMFSHLVYPPGGIDWGNRGVPLTPGQFDLLDIDQTLVFFLGGIPNGANKPPQGFSTNASNPALLGGDRISFMNFPPARMATRIGVFPSFMDAYRTQPFLYFSTFAGGRKDGYDNVATNSFNVKPYMTGNNSPKFHKSDTFQIISAGRDGLFFDPNPLVPAPTWSWPPAPLNPGELDNMTNFHDRFLGSP